MEMIAIIFTWCRLKYFQVSVLFLNAKSEMNLVNLFLHDSHRATPLDQTKKMPCTMKRVLVNLNILKDISPFCGVTGTPVSGRVVSVTSVLHCLRMMDSSESPLVWCLPTCQLPSWLPRYFEQLTLRSISGTEFTTNSNTCDGDKIFPQAPKAIMKQMNLILPCFVVFVTNLISYKEKKIFSMAWFQLHWHEKTMDPYVSKWCCVFYVYNVGGRILCFCTGETHFCCLSTFIYLRTWTRRLQMKFS